MVDKREQALEIYTEVKAKFRKALLNDSNIIGPFVGSLDHTWTFLEKMAFLEVAADLQVEGKLPEIHGKLVEKFALSTAIEYAKTVGLDPRQARRGMANGITRVFEIFPCHAQKIQVQQLKEYISHVEPT